MLLMTPYMLKDFKSRNNILLEKENKNYKYASIIKYLLTH